MPFIKSGKRAQFRIQEIEKDLPARVRKEPKPGDNPLKRPYPQHARDIEEVAALLEQVPRDVPSDFCQRDLRTLTKPQGVLYFHILDIQDIKLSKKDFIVGAPFSIYAEYECQGTIKCSYPVQSHRIPKIRIDHHAYFSADVSEIRNDEANDFVIHVYAFQDPEKHWLIGSQLLHLYNFVREIHGINTVHIQDDLSYHVGRVTFEFAWSYGAYGYGHSNQLRNTKNPIYDTVCHSMFPRIAPSPDDLIDNKFRVRMPKRLRLVNLHSLLVRVPVTTKKEKRGLELAKSVHGKQDFNKEAKTVVFRRVKFSRGRPVHAAVNLDIHQKFMENDFNHSYGEFICLRSRSERLQHLTRMVEGRLRDRVETGATDIFHPINDIDDCRSALMIKKPLACPPGYLQHSLHPQNKPPRPPVKLTDKDEEFIGKFTSAPRFSGYLSTVFGYIAQPKSALGPVEKHEFHVSPNAFLGGGEQETDTMTWCQRFRYRMKRFWYKTILFVRNFCEFLFPSVATNAETTLPEISVTLPSPADSTIDFYNHCVQEKVYPKVAELTETKRETANLVRTARRKTHEEEDEENQWQTEDSEVEPDPNPTAMLGDANKASKRVRDVRALQHVEKAQFRTQNVRPKINQTDIW